MRGYLKQSSTIPQCRQCFSLRYADLQGTPCPTCLRLLGEVFTDVTMLPLSADASDERPQGPVFMQLEGAVSGGIA